MRNSLFYDCVRFTSPNSELIEPRRLLAQRRKETKENRAEKSLPAVTLRQTQWLNTPADIFYGTCVPPSCIYDSGRNVLRFPAGLFFLSHTDSTSLYGSANQSVPETWGENEKNRTQGKICLQFSIYVRACLSSIRARTRAVVMASPSARWYVPFLTPRCAARLTNARLGSSGNIRRAI